MNKKIPTKKQLEFLDWEFGAFFHFGIRTFYEGHEDWDGKPMPLSGFTPTLLDCENWIETVKEAGAKYAILVCKHHDGFANWPSKYTDYGVQNTPWKNGQGDVVEEFVNACRKHDIKVGLYYSPAEEGYKKRTPKEHDDYFINQIGELLTNYGKIDYLWFDGCGSEDHEYDKKRIIKAIRDMQPEILIFNMWDPDVRWIGNEGGVAPVTHSNITKDLDFSVMTSEKDSLGEEMFLPGECDFMMRDRWFYSEYDAHMIKSVEELIGIYYHSIGNGANFLINISPDRRGLLPEVDARRLLEFGKEVRERFEHPIPSECIKEKDGVTLKLSECQLVNHLVLGEDLSKGEMIQGFEVYIKNFIIQQETCIYQGTTIGHKRIITFPSVKASEIVIKVIKARGECILNESKAFYLF